MLVPWAGAKAGLLDALDGPQQKSVREFLPPDDAFAFNHEAADDGRLALHWTIAPGYYLYRDKLHIEALNPGTKLGDPALPASETEDDPEFGPVQIYRNELAVTVPLAIDATAEPTLRVTYQGCAEDGICYPPIKKTFTLAKAALQTAAPPPRPVETTGSESDQIASRLGTDSLPVVLASFFGFGLLLALTPCVFPMIPILSGIIVGQQGKVGVTRGLVLSGVYVLAMAATYALAGIAAGVFGRNLQTTFQHPAVLIAVSAMFVALALSMFGFYTLQLPSAWQTRLERTSRIGHGGHLAGVALMGSLSALIVGPCVAPPLAGALLYLAKQGDPTVGGLALFALGLGMGVPLLAVGASAGQLLPRAGQWLEQVKNAFGVIALGMAIWFASRLLPPAATLGLWALLLIGTAVFLGALEPLRDAATGWQRLWKGLGLAALCYGAVLIVGAAAGADNVFQPLAPLSSRTADQGTQRERVFTPVKGLPEFQQQVDAAAAAGRPVLLDFYADWCIECKHLERQTFAHPEVQAALDSFVLLRADVTANDPADQGLLAHFELFGPPAVLLFDTDRQERRAQRLVGFADAEDFITRLRAAYAQ